MATSALLRALVLFQLTISGLRLSAGALSTDYYDKTCPFAEMIVRTTVFGALQKDPTLSGALLRMHFHDCFVEGCDGSVLIDSTKGNQAEKDSPANLSLRGFEVIDQAKDQIESRCGGVVSCADIVAMAARDAVLWARGPYYAILKGRKDGTSSRIEATVKLPPPTLDATGLIAIFGQRGFSIQEMVALSGGHTLGVARCSSFKSRLSNFNSTNDVDPSLNPNFASILARVCSSGGDNASAPLDWSSTSFDNAYFRLLQMNGGVLTSDQTLFSDPQTRGIVATYATSQDAFFSDFAGAMVKMGSLDVKEAGEVRRNCRRIK